MKQADVKKIDFPEDEQAGLSGQDSIVTHRVSDETDKFKAGDIVESPWGDKYEVSDRKDISKVEDSPYCKELTDSQKALLKVYNRIAVLRLKRQEKKAEPRLYTYLPKDNTVLKDGILSTVMTDKGFEKYRGRTGKYTKEDVLEAMDSWEPEWTRSKAISALTQPIPPDAADDFLEFAKNHKLYSFDIKDLIKAKILAHLRRARKGGGTDPVDDVKKERLDWHRKKKRLLFQGIPHYFVETTEGKIPPEFVREEKKAEQAPSEEDLRRMYDIVQSDAKLTRRIEGLGFGRDGEAYRKAAIRLRVMELAKVLRDGKRVRNRIVHAPGYIPSKQDADRVLQQYADAHAGLTRFLNGEERMTQEGK